jgi:hypothetical protein
MTASGREVRHEGTQARREEHREGAVVIAEYMGETDTFDRAIVNFAKRYAEQNDHDYDALLHAVESGRLRSERGV